MKLENQVVSLELANKLKELGVKQDSFFKWGNICIDGQYHWSLYVPPEYNKVPNPSLWVHGVSAFTVAELGEMFPPTLGEPDIEMYVYDNPRMYELVACDYKTGNNVRTAHFSAKECTEADARAKCLIYLIENGLIEGYEKA